MNHRLIINKGILRIRQLGIFSPGETPPGKQHLCKSGLFIPPNSCKGRRRELTPKSCLLTSTQAPWYVNPLSFSHNLIIQFSLLFSFFPSQAGRKEVQRSRAWLSFFLWSQLPGSGLTYPTWLTRCSHLSCTWSMICLRSELSFPISTCQGSLEGDSWHFLN